MATLRTLRDSSVRRCHAANFPFSDKKYYAGQQNSDDGNEYLKKFAKTQKLLEINPRSPLMEGLLRRVEQLPSEEEGEDLEAEEELKEAVSILIDSALVRSGYGVTDSNQ